MSSPSKKPRPGRIIRISKEVENLLKRKRRKGEGYDAILRRFLGLSDRKGTEGSQPLVYFLLPNDGKPLLFENEAEAKGAAITQAIRKEKKKTERVVKVQEVP